VATTEDAPRCTGEDHYFTLPEGVVPSDLRCLCGAMTWGELHDAVKEATPDTDPEAEAE
jgi:hypothetical protein